MVNAMKGLVGSVLLAGHLGLDNLTVIVDYNKIQSFWNSKGGS